MLAHIPALTDLVTPRPAEKTLALNVPLWHIDSMETLSEYLEAEGLNYSQFAEMIGTNPSSVLRYATGSRIPEHDIMLQIFKITRGRVQPNSFHLREAKHRRLAEARANASITVDNIGSVT